MKLNVFKVAFTLLVFVTFCMAGFNFGSAENAAENLEVAIKRANFHLSGGPLDEEPVEHSGKQLDDPSDNHLGVRAGEGSSEDPEGDQDRLTAELPWIIGGDTTLHNNMVKDLHNRHLTFSHLGTIDDHDLYGMDRELRLQDQKEPKDRVFLFAVQRGENGHFEPLGFARYGSGDMTHDPDSFWVDSGYNRLIRRWEQLRAKGNFPPDFVDPARAPGPQQ